MASAAPSSSSFPPARPLGLLAPSPDRPCGIADYAEALARALERQALARGMPVLRAAYEPVWTRKDWRECRALLVHYERSRVPAGYLRRLARHFPGRVFVIPHEVHESDPFAFPYAEVGRGRPLLGPALRLLYRLRHRGFFREVILQKNGYHAFRVFPLCDPNRAILEKRGTPNLGAVIPLALTRSPVQAGEKDQGEALGGVFGFLTPANDYEEALDFLASCPAPLRLVFVGGERRAGNKEGPVLLLARLAREKGVEGRMQVTGYLPQDEADRMLRSCDFFLAPYRFRSNSASLLHLLRFSKPVLARDLPLTRYLVREGAPLLLYSSPGELRALFEKVRAAGFRAAPNRYPYGFDEVAALYLREIEGGGAV